jgi:hypothetical protein
MYDTTAVARKEWHRTIFGGTATGTQQEEPHR